LGTIDPAPERRTVKATETLHDRGQSLWLDNITRSLLDDGTIQKYIDSYSVTGLTSNPSIFDKAIGSGDYDNAIRTKSGRGLSSEELFFELAIEELRRAADLFLPVHKRTDRIDGWVSLEVSPLLAYDTTKTVDAAKSLYARAGRANLFIKIPGTAEGLPAITEAIAAGVPVNVTLLFSVDHYRLPRMPIYKGWSAGWPRASIPPWARWPRCSCPAGIRPWPSRCLPTSWTSWVWRSAWTYTGPTGS
jgi:hypothetical protein